MLQYRLTDDQIGDLATFLLRGVPERGRRPPRPRPRRTRTPRAIAAGRATFIKRGCYSCHHLPGVSASGKIGPSLSGVADRDPDQLAYGRSGARHTTDNYIFVKLLQPDALGSPSSMPTFGFTPADAATITIALAGLHKADLPASRVVRAAVAAAVPASGALRRTRHAVPVPQLPQDQRHGRRSLDRAARSDRQPAAARLPRQRTCSTPGPCASASKPACPCST